MSTNMPTAVDTFPTALDLSNDTLATKPHSTLHGNLGDALLATETLLLNHHTRHGSGGADAITNLGPVTVHETFSVLDATESTVFTVFEDSGNHYIQGRTADGAAIEFRATNNPYLNLTNPLGQDAASLKLADLTLTDANGIIRATLQSTPGLPSLILLDQLGNPNVALGENAIDATFYNLSDPTNPAARIFSSDTSLLLEHYASAGTGILRESMDMTDSVVTFTKFDAAGGQLGSWELGDGGTNLDARDADNLLHTDLVLGTQATLSRTDADLDTESTIAITSAGIRLIPDPTLGLAVFDATPGGKDAFLANCDISTVVARVNALIGYQIARGWMAAS